MKSRVDMADILSLSPAEKILLVETIWDSIAGDADAIPITEAQKRELDARAAAFERDPTAGAPWSEVKARIKGGE